MTKNSKPGVQRAAKMLVCVRELRPRIEYAYSRLTEEGFFETRTMAHNMLEKFDDLERDLKKLLGDERLEKLQAPAKPRGRNIKITRKRLTKNPR